jgi:hypothetical protein
MTPTQRFELPLAQGLAWLDLPCTEPGEGLSQARALGAALPALAALEAWLAVDLPCPDPVPAPVAGAGSAAASHLVLTFEPGSVLAGGQLVLPWSALKPGRQAPSSLPVQWPQLPAQLCLQVLPRARIAASGLVAGAVLLLPAGFLGPWPAQLHGLGSGGDAPPAGWLVAATWQPRDARLSLSGGPVQCATDSSVAEVWSVWLTAPLAVDLRAWFGGCPSAPLVPVTRAELRLGREPVAVGSLLPCGAGWGLRIERVEGQASPEGLVKAAAWT